MWKSPISVPRAGCSLRRGWPSHQGGMRMRLRCWMTVDRHAEHVPDFPLVPIGARPDPRDAGRRRPVARERQFDADVLVSVEGKQVIDHREVGRRLPLAVRAASLVDRGEVVEHRIGAARCGLQIGERLDEPLPPRPRPWGCRRQSAGARSSPRRSVPRVPALSATCSLRCAPPQSSRVRPANAGRTPSVVRAS